MQFRLRDFAYPRDILQLRRQFARFEQAEPELLRAYQEERLGALALHAQASSPFWRLRFAQAGFDPRDRDLLRALAALPILSKDELRQHADEIRSREWRRFAPRLVRSSGSTGTPLEIWLDRPTNVLEFATLWREFNWAGYRMGQRFADLRGHLIAAPSGIERDLRLNALNLSAFDLRRERARLYVATLRDFRPVMVRGYPSSLARLAAWVLEDGLSLPSPVAVVTSSETLLLEQRRLIESAFRAPVFDYYGQSERVAFAGQCAAGSYHVAAEYGLVELVDGSGREAPPGVPGRLIATGLHHRAMPLLRYETRDLAVRLAGRCPCGRSSQRLARIDGRLEDLVLTPEGRHVGRLDAALQNSPGIRLAQIVQEEVASIQVRVVARPSYGESDERALLAGLRDRLGERIAIQIERVADIEAMPSGKLKFVVSRLARSSPVPTVGYPQDGQR